MDFFSFHPPHNLSDNYYTCLWNVPVHQFAQVHATVVLTVAGLVLFLSIGWIKKRLTCMCSPECLDNFFTTKFRITIAIGWLTALFLLIGKLYLIWVFYIPILLYKLCVGVYRLFNVLVRLFTALADLGFPCPVQATKKLEQLQHLLKIDQKKDEETDQKGKVKRGLCQLLACLIFVLLTFLIFYVSCALIRAAQFVYFSEK
ncbi:hypothetical protein M3Y97_00944000 [Aphelenchoides bicaudatus]|nr:hypothetical protein M3Y97_00944000 [Aphelenchoides bicaudatus]